LTLLICLMSSSIHPHSPAHEKIVAIRSSRQTGGCITTRCYIKRSHDSNLQTLERNNIGSEPEARSEFLLQMTQRDDTPRKRARSVAGGAPPPDPLRLPPQLDCILRLHSFRDLHWYFVIERELREELEASKKVAVTEPESLLHNKEWILQGMTKGAVFGLSMTETDSLVYHAGARTDESFMGDNGCDRRAFILPVFCLVRGDRLMLMWTAGSRARHHRPHGRPCL
jgi:hypothetical protein